MPQDPRRKLLVVEDEPSVARQLQWGLGGTYDITVAADADQAARLLAARPFAVVTLDLGLPPFPDSPAAGLRLLEEGAIPAGTKVIVITGNAEEETAVRAVGLGVTDFCPKPVDLGQLEVLIARAFRMHDLEAAGVRQRGGAGDGGEFCGMLGAAPAMGALFARIQRASATEFPVLVTGESGTGKEMIAQAVHRLSRRAGKPLVVVNCGAIPEQLVESELFGHEKGAFTGAHAARPGKFEEAQGGTVFLDEVGELPLAAQVKLLRTLQEGTVERLGGRRPIPLSLRFVAATNVDLEQAVAGGRFRRDLYHRLNVVPLHAPPLRERREDIPFLARRFIDDESKALRLGRVTLSSAALEALVAHDWPGNVRELQNAIRRALADLVGTVIRPPDLGLADAPPGPAPDGVVEPLAEVRRKAEAAAVRQAMALTGNNISQAARLLSVSRPTLHDLLKKHPIKE